MGGQAYGWLYGREQVSGLLLEICTAWLHLWFDVTLLFSKVNKKRIQTCASFYTSREVPVLTETNAFYLLALHCRASAAQISSKFPGMLRGNLELWEFFAKCWSLVLSAYVFLISNF